MSARQGVQPQEAARRATPPRERSGRSTAVASNAEARRYVRSSSGQESQLARASYLSLIAPSVECPTRPTRNSISSRHPPLQPQQPFWRPHGPTVGAASLNPRLRSYARIELPAGWAVVERADQMSWRRVSRFTCVRDVHIATTYLTDSQWPSDDLFDRRPPMRGAVMAVAFRMEFPGATLDQYDEVIQKMGLTPGGPTPPGAIFHWVAGTDDGLLVVQLGKTKKSSTSSLQTRSSRSRRKWAWPLLP